MELSRPTGKLSELCASHRLLVCVGPGGVGKTTLAAALALEGARQGRRALVLTIDPARRLAGALSLDGLDDEVRQVPLSRLSEAGVIKAGGELSAAMLDTRSSFDALIGRSAGSAEAAQRIKANRVYAAFSRTLARSHAQIAMERLYDLASSGRYELVVLDTPPLRSALQILDAPERLTRFLDEGIVRWFLRPERGRLSRLIPSGGAAAARLLGVLASHKLVTEAADFFRVLLPLEQGFRERARGMTRMLRDSTTAFVLVCSPSAGSLDDAAFLRDGLAERGVRLEACVVNRAYVGERNEPECPVWERHELGGALAFLASQHRLAREMETRALLLGLEALRVELADANRGAEELTSRFLLGLRPGTRVVRLPEHERDVRDLAGLNGLCQFF